MCYTSAIYHRNRHVPIPIGIHVIPNCGCSRYSYCCRRKLSWVIEQPLGWVIEMAPSWYFLVFFSAAQNVSTKSGAMLGCLVGGKSYQHTVYVLLMEEILHQLICSLSHYLQGFILPRWCRISSINSMFGIVSYIPNLTVIYTLNDNFHLLFSVFKVWLLTSFCQPWQTCVKHHTILVVFFRDHLLSSPWEIGVDDLPYPVPQRQAPGSSIMPGKVRCGEELCSWRVNRDPPGPRSPPPFRNKGLIAGLIEGNLWLRSPDHKAFFCGGVGLS